ncbi:MAG: glycoside hydrolase family 15 protein [Candidatus Sericytochromatia bacterium]|nr:glycoside hydrolase family 15 protein [Candidatus Sericytochromatia bacterium]
MDHRRSTWNQLPGALLGRRSRRLGWIRGLIGIGLAASLVSACGLSPLRPAQATPVDRLGMSASGLDMSGPGSWLFGVCPNFSQVSNGRVMSAVSREFGRLARPGALINMLWPSYAENRLRVATVGFHDGRSLRWADELRLVSQRVVPDTGRVISTFAEPKGRYRLVIEDLAVRDVDVIARRVTLENTGVEALNGGSFMALADFALTLTGRDDRLSWRPAEQALLVQNPEAGCATAMAGDDEPSGYQCGAAGLALGPAVAAGIDARDGRLSGHRSAQGVAGTEGALSFDVPALAPGARHSQDLYLSVGAQPEAALAAIAHARRQGFTRLAEADAGFWRDHLARAPRSGGDAREEAVFRRALIVIKQLQADTGGILAAASTISPAYKYVWIQDLVVDVRALALCGYHVEARAALDFMARTQKADGDWWVTHRGDGKPFLAWEHGSEWMGGYWVSAVDAYVAASRDQAAIAAWWPQIERACRFMQAQITPSGLIGPNMDLWETFKDKSWTLTNASFVGGLEAAARMADRTGRSAQAGEWRRAAQGLREALRVQAVVAPEGYWGKGVRPGATRPDPIIDASVLGATWPYGVVSPQDPITRATMARIQQRLLQPGGGVRRWEGDDWYGAQGWCELTDWLALVAHQAGDTALAKRLHASNTDKAHTTGSLQLGEVFDERTGRFTSAFPLGWPEAQYVLTSLAFQGRVPLSLPPQSSRPAAAGSVLPLVSP